ncbi:DNA replication/repair protein RecF [Hathewaya histolytica]|uniref:DNA replication and repair protein RecF n=1 Tax=Hathewaya histolytica TaxID=1498 RepID=A0A4U9QT68_HATHI|nr:DNA replication/repair protein RecF [Hathewaya histolytica]VTQ81449.1 recombination protein F [Hathewaya histolytica]
MDIRDIQLVNFRNYNNQYIKPCRGINVFVGDNAQGKTNVVESIYYCSLGKSHRTNKDKDLIMWGKEEAYISIYINKERLDKKIELKIFKHGKKGVNINSVKITKISDLIGVLNAVIFSPEDLKIVKDSPSFRRKFLDIELCKLSKKYFFHLSQYKKALNERNAAMKKIKDMEVLNVFDLQLSKFGAEIIRERVKYIEKLNNKGGIIHKDITSEKENLEIKYLTAVKDFENIEKDLYSLLLKNRGKDIEYKTTSVGPHRDDFSIEINGIDTRVYGSQGQQRTSVLTIKFASLEIIKEITGEYPILLLDDVLSELDINRQRYILGSLKNIQTFITCTGINEIEKYTTKDNCKIFKVSEGIVTE